jgi:hypothetical protein
MTDADLVAKIQQNLRDLRAQEDQLTATMEGLARKRDELREQIEDHARTLKVIRQISGVEPEAQSQPALFTDVPLGTIAEMAENIILNAGGKVRVGDLVRILTDTGKLKSSRGRGNYATVYSILTRDKRFRKAGEGTFTVSAPNGAKPN